MSIFILIIKRSKKTNNMKSDARRGCVRYWLGGAGRVLGPPQPLSSWKKATLGAIKGHRGAIPRAGVAWQPPPGA